MVWGISDDRGLLVVEKSLIEREKRRKKGEMDLGVTSLLEEALQQGIWAALYI